jgi:IclR family transcriptional regulator, mhp operon transcriptional activator
MVEPRSSGTIAAPIMDRRNVLATVGMTYFTSALSRTELMQHYVPRVLALAGNISASVSALR